ncbi:hypothetical protein SAMN05444414_11250 [Roseovarius marisflavi]|uniref:Uncharacterized protein n=1 Tax=Roseovarius marisflavi TaxID=1054996 RepID=A0A1M7A524_9RHOB|nr:hypothetical protein SAMN05444414_11250 [Roseovarius marisflavi]
MLPLNRFVPESHLQIKTDCALANPLAQARSTKTDPTE